MWTMRQRAPAQPMDDNMKAVVDRVGVGKARDINQRFAAECSHHLFEPELCNPASGWEKGQVENDVRDARHLLWRQAPRFATLDEINDWLEQRCQALRPESSTRADVPSPRCGRRAGRPGAVRTSLRRLRLAHPSRQPHLPDALFRSNGTP